MIAEHVLVTTDGSEASNRVLAPALAAIRACDSAKVTLMRVLTPSGGPNIMHALDWALAHAQIETDLRLLVEQFEELRERVEPTVLEGRAAEQILRYVDTHAIDLLVFASHGSNDARAWGLGSVARKLVAKSRSSLLLIPAEFEFEGFNRVLVPLDCSARAEVVLPLLPKLADAHNPEVILMHVVARPEFSHRLPTGGRDVELADELTSRNQERAEAYLSSVRDRLLVRGVRARIEVLADINPARAIERYSGDCKTDLVLLGAHGAGSHEGEAYGTVARRLLESPRGLLWIVQDLPMNGLERGARAARTRVDRA